MSHEGIEEKKKDTEKTKSSFENIFSTSSEVKKIKMRMKMSSFVVHNLYNVCYVSSFFS